MTCKTCGNEVQDSRRAYCNQHAQDALLRFGEHRGGVRLDLHGDPDRPTVKTAVRAESEEV